MSIKVFLTSCTDADPLHPQNSALTAYAPYHSDKNPERAKKTIVELKALFGPGDTAPITAGYPDKTSWDITTDQISKALDYLIAGQPWPPAAFGPIELLLVTTLRLSIQSPGRGCRIRKINQIYFLAGPL